MDENNDDGIGLAGAGRWLALASELPCAIIVFLFLGQIVGEALFGPSGGTVGGIVGVLIGLVFGTYSIYVTAQHLDRIERAQSVKRQYMPPMEEITREYDWPQLTENQQDSD